MRTHSRCSVFMIPGQGFVPNRVPTEVPIHYTKLVIEIVSTYAGGFQTPVRHVQDSPQQRHTQCLGQTNAASSFRTQAQPCHERRTVADSSQELPSGSHFCIALHSVAGLLGPQPLSVPVPSFFFFNFFPEVLPFILPPFPQLFCL